MYDLSKFSAALVPSVDHIERHVERMVDALDRRFMRGDLTQAEYDAEMKSADAWAEAQYDRRRAAGWRR